MQQLSGVDAAFLNMETASQFGHVGNLTIYEAGPGDEDALTTITRTLGSRLHRLPVFRRRLASVPLGLDHPYWVDDADFDLDFHIRHTALAAPGDERQLAELVAEAMSRPLDRSRPLWELYVVDGLAGGETAVLTKMHHAYIDGATNVEVLTAMLDPTPDATAPIEPAVAWTPEPTPSSLEMLGRTVASLAAQPRALARLQLRAVRGVARATRDIGLDDLADLLAYGAPGPVGRLVRRANRRFVRSSTDPDEPPRLPGAPAPKTSFNAAISPHRRFAFTTTSLAEAKVVKDAYGTTINDVVMALCSGALRRYLSARGELPADPLIAVIPVSLRTSAEAGAFSNRVSAVLAPLATNLADPGDRLRAIHDSMTAAKEMQAALPVEVLQDMAVFAPPALAARATRMTSRIRIADRTNPPFNLVISNVPGPRSPLYLAGAQLRAFYPVSTVADGQGLNMTVHSYLDSLDWGFMADRALVPDVEDLSGHLHEAMAELFAAARAQRDGHVTAD